MYIYYNVKESAGGGTVQRKQSDNSPCGREKKKWKKKINKKWWGWRQGADPESFLVLLGYCCWWGWRWGIKKSRDTQDDDVHCCVSGPDSYGPLATLSQCVPYALVHVRNVFSKVIFFFFFQSSQTPSPPGHHLRRSNQCLQDKKKNTSLFTIKYFLICQFLFLQLNDFFFLNSSFHNY